LRAPNVAPSTSSATQAYVDEALRWLPDEEAGRSTPARADTPAVQVQGINGRFARTYGSRILLADDNADMRAYLRNLLEPYYVVDLVRDGQDALSRAAELRPDLVLTDVMMPRLDHLISNSIESAEFLLREKGHSIVIHPGPGALTVMGDPQRLVQCIGNVLANAAKYTPPSGEIRVRTRREGNEAVVTISDNGIGIPAAMLPKVFDLFAQGARLLDRSQGGLGIGLAIVKRLIEMHGGSVAVHSDGADMGASFEIRLPLAEVGTALGAPQQQMPVPARRILVVDDNRDAADVLSTLLQDDGHEVETAYSSRDALSLLQRFEPDVILLDIGLPEIDGFELARRIREQAALQHVRLIALTGYGQEEIKERAHSVGFAAHLLKPVEFSRLQKLLAE
jgi:CheY-like chemotaxis protein